ncbi:YdcF family protein [Rufibacter sediminis]|uniref:YdcF family protein n=1 Tax=Rufibacter sediminis TaxID=2762756 RepID=A0ABR6VPS5_9BACT|nr:YdcF family protein [Rufibacter sediminis]MBC3539195.1 YdcF family protein [Rufibacter sediminis]
MIKPFLSLSPKPLLAGGLAILSLLSACSPKAPATASATGQTATQTLLQQKIYPLLVTLQESPYQAELQKSETLRQLASQRAQRVKQAVQTCSDVPCLASSVQWSAAEVQQVGNELVRLFQSSKRFQNVVQPLKASGKYELYAPQPDTAFLRSAWQNSAQAMNHATDVYFKGKKPRYPKIDAISFELTDPAFHRQVRQALEKAVNTSGDQLFFQIPLQVSLEALAINGRDEAVRYEPLHQGLNAGPFQQAKSTDWKNFKYSLILVPGFGPEEEGIVLHDKAKSRCRMALERYQKGLAPFIVVSGGNVHPNKTPYNEAVEMKKYMVDSLGVAEQVVIIEPHARHTTTNLRNTNRLLYTLQLPLDRPILIVTDESQSSYIMRFEKKAKEELGYAPFQKLKKLSDVETEYYSVSASRQVDPLDHLDP